MHGWWHRGPVRHAIGNKELKLMMTIDTCERITYYFLRFLNSRLCIFNIIVMRKELGP